jgi:hypothetical protein
MTVALRLNRFPESSVYYLLHAPSPYLNSRGNNFHSVLNIRGLFSGTLKAIFSAVLISCTYPNDGLAC